jgi:cytochrome bd ubiquinol oxidase subunit I
MDRLPDRVHFFTGIPIAVAGVTGSLSVISVNAWMNHPGGCDVVNGKVINTDPWVALFNDHLWYEFTHMYLPGFLVAGVYAAAWLKGRRDLYHRAGLIIALTSAILAAPVQIVVGDWAGRRGSAGQAGRV